MRFSQLRSPLALSLGLLIPAHFVLMGQAQCPIDTGTDNDEDGYTVEQGDCDDNNGSVYPGAAEDCDGIDNNCDTQVDEGLLVTLYVDSDGDGYGGMRAVEACPGTPGTSTNNTDCADGDGSVNPGASEICGDGIDQDCSGRDLPCSGGNTLSYADDSSDNIKTTAVYDFFASQTLSSSSFIFFSISGGGSYDGDWCSERADWYQSNYLMYASGNTYLMSGDWNKWSRPEGGSWSEPTTTPYYNFFGASCDNAAYSWCSEWGVGNMYLATMPADGYGYGESYASDWSYGAGWKVVIRTGATRGEACGF